MKKIAISIVVLSLFIGVVFISPLSAKADNMSDSNSMFMNARASLKIDTLTKLESVSGVVLGPNNSVRVLGAKVTSVAINQINATATFGNSFLNFVVNVDTNTQLNGRDSSSKNPLFINSLKVGDIVSFSGTMSSSSGSSIIVAGDQVVSRAFVITQNDKTNFKGEVTAVNVLDNSLTLNFKGSTLKVVVNSSTIITVDNTIKTLVDIKAGDEVKITGTLNSGATIITATKIGVNDNDQDNRDQNRKNEDKRDKEDNGKNNKSEKNGWFKQMTNWLFR